MRCFKNIAQLIRTKRMNHPKGYSQSELSHLLGYKNGQFISNVERALCNIPLKMLKKVSEVLDIPAEDLKAAILRDQEETLNNYLYNLKPSKKEKVHSSSSSVEMSVPAAAHFSGPENI
jgi:transcriptional regulator with XRE-family HTH domain